MLNTDTSIDLKRVLYLSIAFVGLLLLTRLAVPFMRRNNKSRSLTDLKSLARSYISFQDGDNTSRAKSFTGEKKRECISCVNFRDCGMVSPELRQGCIYRSSQVFSSDELQALKLEAVLDLRVLKKHCRREADQINADIRRTDSREKANQMRAINPDGASSSEDDGYVGMHSLESRRHKEGLQKCGVCTAEFGTHHGVSVPVYHSDLVPWRTKLRVFGKLPAGYKMKALGELAHLRNPEKLIAGAVVDPDIMGPNVLYKLLLDHSKPSFAVALRLFASKDNYPVLVHCIHGKDRTGLIIMLLLLLCNVPPKLVVADYIQSELQLKAGRDKGDLHELDEFLKTDHVIASKAETMVETIAHLDSVYGGAREYAKLIGLSDSEVSSIITNMKTKPTEDVQAARDTVEALQGPEGSSLSKPQLQKLNEADQELAKPAAAGTETPHNTMVLSDVALQAARDAIEEEETDKRSGEYRTSEETRKRDKLLKPLKAYKTRE